MNGEALKEKEAELYEGKRVVGFWAAAFFLTLFEALFANYVVVLFSDVLLGYFKAVPEVDAVLPILVIIAVSAITATVVLFANMASPFKLAWDKSGKKKAEKN